MAVVGRRLGISSNGCEATLQHRYTSSKSLCDNGSEQLWPGHSARTAVRRCSHRQTETAAASTTSAVDLGEPLPKTPSADLTAASALCEQCVRPRKGAPALPLPGPSRPLQHATYVPPVRARIAHGSCRRYACPQWRAVSGAISVHDPATSMSRDRPPHHPLLVKSLATLCSTWPRCRVVAALGSLV